MSGTLATYIGLGSGGCTIGQNTLNDFRTISGIAGATPISTADVSISPLGGNLNPGITASVSQVTGANSQLDLLFTYQISGASYVADSITLAGSSETADGAVTDIQNFCAGGAFGPDGVSDCAGLAGSLLTLDGVQNQDSTALGPASFIGVTDDLTLDGGLMGSASGGSITDRFSAVPEPFGYFLTGLGLALGLAAKLTSAGRNRRKL
ncbi:MAG TPA: hypothetical protein VHU83_07105 [Bryobacteraceae bacterium]|jgi:hypothetical protein|nr:hypothetical protein [Bryobacteraceae bacterium]